MRVAVLAALAVAVAGCESTADKSAKLAAASEKVVQQKGLAITTASTEVLVSATKVLSDENGTAVVAELRNTGKRTLAGIPVAIAVKDGAGKTIFRNDNPGAERALVSVPSLGPGERIEWVHDQVLATTKAASVVVTVGAAQHAVSAPLPKLTLGAQKLESDPSSGVAVASSVRNTAAIEQKELTVFAVARRGREIVAAGRALIPRARPGREARFAVYFIGNPTGAQVTMAAPATTLE